MVSVGAFQRDNTLHRLGVGGTPSIEYHRIPHPEEAWSPGGAEGLAYPVPRISTPESST